VIIVDDRLASEVLAGARSTVPGEGPVATTWGFHYRLVRALADHRVSGQLTRGQPDDLQRASRTPGEHGLIVLDPRELTASTAEASIQHRLNLLTAELVAAAHVHGAEVVLTSGNVGRTWPDLFASLSIPLSVI
jgi:hypothetical protein